MQAINSKAPAPGEELGRYPQNAAKGAEMSK
jgi:hypothetical protein